MHFVILLKFRQKNQRHLRQTDIFKAAGKGAPASLGDARLRNLESFRVSNQRRVVIEIADTAADLLRAAAQHAIHDVLLRREILQIADKCIRPRRGLRQDFIEFALLRIDAVLFPRIEIGRIPIQRFGVRSFRVACPGVAVASCAEREGARIVGTGMPVSLASASAIASGPESESRPSAVGRIGFVCGGASLHLPPLSWRGCVEFPGGDPSAGATSAVCAAADRGGPSVFRLDRWRRRRHIRVRHHFLQSLGTRREISPPALDLHVIAIDFHLQWVIFAVGFGVGEREFQQINVFRRGRQSPQSAFQIIAVVDESSAGGVRKTSHHSVHCRSETRHGSESVPSFLSRVRRTLLPLSARK